jgi:hypothetical protein
MGMRAKGSELEGLPTKCRRCCGCNDVHRERRNATSECLVFPDALLLQLLSQCRRHSRVSSDLRQCFDSMSLDKHSQSPNEASLGSILGRFRMNNFDSFWINRFQSSNPNHLEQTGSICRPNMLLVVSWLQK